MGKVAFVLGGGGVLGAHEVGMLRALSEAGVRPDVVVGTSIGAINGVFVAADPDNAAERLRQLWADNATRGSFMVPAWRRVATFARSGTHLHPVGPLLRALESELPVTDFEDLAVPFQCVAASIETAMAHWFSSGKLVPAVLASCAVPGLLPPVRVGKMNYFDGGLVHSIPVGRAVELGADTVYVLHVGRIERPLAPPKRPWEVGMVAFEIARRHRFFEEMASLPEHVEVHVMPAGVQERAPARGRKGSLDAWNDRAYRASVEYLGKNG